MKHVRTLRKLWEAVEQFIVLISREFHVAIEWPQNCRYWKFPRAVKFLDDCSLKSYNFHGCMLGTTDDEGTPIKKPSTVAASMYEVGDELTQFQCDGNRNHVQGRGKSLKNTGSYTFQVTDAVHRAFDRAAHSARKCVTATPAILCPAVMASSSAAAAAGSYPEGQADVGELAHWKQNADFQAEGVYTRVQEWERRLAKVRASCVACAFPDGYEGDSSFALVANHDDPAECSRLSVGEPLQSKDYAVEQIRSVYTGLKWGKGLSAIIGEVWELIAKAERESRLKGRETLPILVGRLGWQ